MTARSFNESPANSQAQIYSFILAGFQTRMAVRESAPDPLQPRNPLSKPAQAWLCSSNKPVPGMTPRPASVGQSREDIWLHGPGSRPDRAPLASAFDGITGPKAFRAVFALWLTTSL